MPELPEVETVRRGLERKIVGKKIKQVSVDWPKTVAPLSMRQFALVLAKRKIVAVERRAKMLIIRLDKKQALVVHLKMTGQLIFRPVRGELMVGGHPQPGGLDHLPNKFTRVIITFADDSTLFFNDMRKFGWMRLLDDDQVTKLFVDVGVEPLSTAFNAKKMREIIERYPRRTIKQILMDQTLIAGIGNIYADEACFSAHILPTRAVSQITPVEITSLVRHIKRILLLSISKEGTSARNYLTSDGVPGGFVPYLNVYGRGNEKCKKCGTKIAKIRHHGRGTHYCPKCQK